MNSKGQIFAALCGVLFLAVYTFGMHLAKLVPVLPPTLSAAELAAFYQQNAHNIILGMGITLLAATLYIPFTIVMSIQLRRINGSSLWADAQSISGGGNAVILMLPPLLFAAIAFRPERSPDITQALTDFSCTLLLMPQSMGIAQVLSIAFGIFTDKSKTPVYPKWIGAFNVAQALSYLPGAFILFDKTGPFAWNGFFGVVLPAIMWLAWFVVMGVYTIKAIVNQARLPAK